MAGEARRCFDTIIEALAGGTASSVKAAAGGPE
jgi:hypothetical protein